MIFDANPSIGGILMLAIYAWVQWTAIRAISQ